MYMKQKKEDEISRVIKESEEERATIEEEQHQAVWRPSLKRRLLPFIVVAVIMVAFFVFSAIYQGYIRRTATLDGSRRIKLEAEYKLFPYIMKSSVYTSKDVLYEKMSAFYISTGVQPIIYDLTGEDKDYSNEELQEIAGTIYKETFPDECHLLIVFRENSSKRLGLAYHVGEEAKTVIDDGALGILTEQINKYFNDNSVPNEDKLSKAIVAAKDEIMGPTSSSIFAYILMFAAVISFLVYTVSVRFKRFKKNPNYLGTPTDARYELYRRSDDRYL